MQYRILVPIVLIVSLLPLMPKPVLAQVGESIMFYKAAYMCGSEFGFSDEFQASGSTQITYSVNSRMSMYVINEAAMKWWNSNGIYVCEPGYGGFARRFMVGSDYPLSGSIQLTLPSDKYFVVFIAFGNNPTASVVLPGLPTPEFPSMLLVLLTVFGMSTLTLKLRKQSTKVAQKR